MGDPTEALHGFRKQQTGEQNQNEQDHAPVLVAEFVENRRIDALQGNEGDAGVDAR